LSEARAAADPSWLAETLYPDWGQRFRILREIAHLRSAFQDILVVESASHGRVMLLDGVVQTTEADEFVYHEMLAHVPLLAHGAARRVLIIGAGDGGVLRRVLQHRSVAHAVLVEIDAAVIRLARAHLPAIGGAAWDDPRAEVLVADGVDYVRQAPSGSFDAVIVDSTDPVGVAEPLFGAAFYADVARTLRPPGVLVNQCGVPFMQGEELRGSSQQRACCFADVSAYLAAAPTYVGGFMALGWAATDPALRHHPAALLRDRAAASGILGTTRYWTPEVHAASFQLPPYIAALLPQR
jgi:spermidine synthase